jgi:recombination protein RecA
MDEIDKIIKDIEKQYGSKSILRLTGEAQSVPVISTGCLTLDIATGVGGIPCGRIIEVYGPESSGKTTLAHHLVAEVQKTGALAAFIDVEQSMDPIYAKAIGVDIDKLLLSQPDYAEQALGIVESLVRTGKVGIIVVDSVAALAPREEIEGEIGDSHVGKVARLMGQTCRMLAPLLNQTNTILCFTNQLREKISTGRAMYGPSETTPGGRALKFAATMRFDVRYSYGDKDGNLVINNRVRVKVVKNKVAPPFHVAEFDIVFGKGIDRMGCLVDAGVMFGVVEKRGAHYYHGETKLGHGRNTAIVYLEDHPELAAEMEALIKFRAAGDETIGDIQEKRSRNDA